MNTSSLTSSVRIAAALADPNRLRIFRLIQKRKMCVCKIIPAVHLPQNLVSHHLGVLRRTGLVQFQREGTHRYYRLNRAVLHRFLQALSVHA